MIKINDLTSFTAPLKSLKNGINSIIFSVDSEGRLKVDTKSQDTSQIANIKWDKKVVEVPSDMEKFGIYNLGEFLTALEMFGSDSKITATFEDNKLSLAYSKSEESEVKYNLSDVTLIQEGPEGPKNAIKFLTNLKLDGNFFKKVKNISASLNVNTLKFECREGTISFLISDKFFHSHVVKETLVKNSKCKTDFDVFVNIEKLNIIPEGKELTININEKIFEFNLEEKDKTSLRYFVAAMVIE